MDSRPFGVRLCNSTLFVRVLHCCCWFFFFFRSRGKRTYFFFPSGRFCSLDRSPSRSFVVLHVPYCSYLLYCMYRRCMYFGFWPVIFCVHTIFRFFLLSLLCLALRVYNIKCHLGFMFGAPFNTISFRSTTSNATCSVQYDSYGFSARIEMAAKLLVQNSIEYKRLHFMQ